MITLYESILGSTKSGKTALIDNWCRENNIFNGFYAINSKGEIERTRDDARLQLPFKDYTELPDYIKFADDKDLHVTLGKEIVVSRVQNGAIARDITSFRGVPKVCKILNIFTNGRKLPDLEVSTQLCGIYCPYAKSFGNITIDMRNGNVPFNARFRILDFGYDITQWPKSFKINNLKELSLVNASDMGDNFSKLLNRKAPMNKYVGKFEFPIAEEGLKNIEQFFGNAVDLKTVEIIKYTQNSELRKHNGQWYRCKNRD